MAVSPHTLRTVAVRATVDPRTVAKVLRRERVHPVLAARIRDALRELGLVHLIGFNPTVPNVIPIDRGPIA